MLFSDRYLFIHAPKTAGMSVTKFLMDNTPDPVTLTVPPGHAASSPKLTVIAGKRHERLSEAVEMLATLGRKLEDFETIISIMRNPYDLEVSYYHYKRLGHPWDKGKAQDLALAGDFAEFARKAPYNGRNPARIEDWYEIDGKQPANLQILRFENLETELNDLVGRMHPVARKLEKKNFTKHAPFMSYVTSEAERAIFRKYRWIFDNNFYPRATVAADARSG
jgi:hypothetical protein